MPWMNEYEIDEAAARFRSHPVLGRATQFLARFRDEVNGHSDGWPHWRLPARAADKLMTLIRDAENAMRRSYPPAPEVTEAQLKAAITPIRAFYTRHGNKAGMQFPELTDESAVKRATYCVPANSGLASEPRAVAKRLGDLIETCDSFSWAICNGPILDDIRAFRDRLMAGLAQDGYVCTYDGGDHMRVYEPGSPTGARKRREHEARKARTGERA